MVFCFYFVPSAIILLKYLGSGYRIIGSILFLQPLRNTRFQLRQYLGSVANSYFDTSMTMHTTLVFNEGQSQKNMLGF